jgi:glycosyltransferase involved in cell wall biosynthesis
MNIIFLETVQIHGGARKSTVELAKRLQDGGHDVTIIDFWGTCDDFISDVSKNNIPFFILNKLNNPIVIFNSRNIIIILKNIFNFFFEWFRLRKKLANYVSRIKPDIVITNNIKTNSILRRGGAYKIVYFARGWFAYNSLGILKKLLFKNHSDYFIGVSQSTRQAIFTGGLAPMSRIFVVPNAIDIEIIEQYRIQAKNTKKDQFVILHCGGFLSDKGHNLSLSLAKRLEESKIDFKMILMGSIYDSSVSINFYRFIENKIKSMNLEDRVFLITDHKNPYEVFKDCDLLIHPSNTEGLPRVIMESMAFGIPVIANPVGGVTDYILHNFTGFLANHNDVEDYFNYTMRLYQNKDLYLFITSNAKTLIKSNYSPINQRNEFEKVINKIRMA